jgi:sulfite reductase (ferredoxin)
VGECAGVMIDLVSTLLYDSEDKLSWSEETLANKHYADSIYQSYGAFINTAKALLLGRDIKPSSQYQTINDFQREFVDTKAFEFEGSFKEHVLRINKQEPSEAFADAFLRDSRAFLTAVTAYRATVTDVVEKVAIEK